jgi:hypothetical protein
MSPIWTRPVLRATGRDNAKPHSSLISIVGFQPVSDKNAVQAS